MKSANKIFGWFLLLFGLAIICWGLFSSYNIFVNQSDPPEFLKIEQEVLIREKETAEIPLSQKAIQEELERMIGEEIREVLPIGPIYLILNLIIWSIFAGLLIFGGAQISGIGVRLIKD